MDIATSKNKIVEVLAYAREVSIRHGHTGSMPNTLILKFIRLIVV